MNLRALKIITQTILFSVIAVLPFVKTITLYFPFISGKVYLFRGLVALAFFFWSWFILKRMNVDRWRVAAEFKNILVVALILFFLAQVFVSFFGVDPFFSFFSSIDRQDGVFQYGFWLLYFLMLISVLKDEYDWKMFFFIFAAVALVFSLYSFFNIEGRVGNQFSALFGNPAYFGAFLLFAIGFSVIAALLKLPLFLVAAVFFAVTLVFTQIRGVYAGLAGGVFLFCLLAFLFLRRENKKMANWCGVFLLVGTLFAIGLFIFRETDFIQNSRILSRITQVADFWQVSAVRERVLNWNIALKAFKEKPLFGWGPENYGAAANKYYDFRIGENEPWFDRAHSQPLDILATGGIILFVFYLFWIFAVFFLIWKIGKQRKILSFILASIFLAYLIQGFFLFDTLAVYLGLFPFLAYLVVVSQKPLITADKLPINTDKKISGNQQPSLSKIRKFIIFASAVFSLFLIYTTVIVPWQANHSAWNFFNLTKQGFYKEAKPYLERAFNVKSPYTYWELRKMTGWSFVEILQSETLDSEEPSKIKEIQNLYDFIVPELERFITSRPTQPSNYHVLAEIYRLGFERLGKNDLQKAEEFLKKAFLQSDLRIEYFNDFVKIALLRGNFEEAERVILAYAARMPQEWGAWLPFMTLGNFYFEAARYERALKEYDKALMAGFQIHRNETAYPRYMLAAEAIKNYERIVEMAKKRLEYKGPDADTYFNIAVGYWHIGDKKKAREFFLKSVELKPENYEEYRNFFIE